MNVLVVDDHIITVHGLINLRLQPALPDAKIFTAQNYRDAISIAYQETIDLLICDLDFDNDPDHNGECILHFFQEMNPNIRAIAYTLHNTYKVLKSAKKAGFHCFLDKGCSYEEFETAVLLVLKNGAYQSKSEKRLLKKYRTIFDINYLYGLKAVRELTKNELQILIFASETIDKYKLSELLIADGRLIAPQSVDTNIKHIVKKLQLRNREELFLFCCEYKDLILKCYQNN